MKKRPFILLIALFAICMAISCAGPWTKVKPGEPIHTFLDIPMDNIIADPEKYKGTVIEDRFKFYQIYRSKEDVIPEISKQTIRGETYFTARPINQYIYVIQIRITRGQDKWIRNKGIHRQDAIKARVRFAGIAPSGVPAFDLLEIFE